VGKGMYQGEVLRNWIRRLGHEKLGNVVGQGFSHFRATDIGNQGQSKRLKQVAARLEIIEHGLSDQPQNLALLIQKYSKGKIGLRSVAKINICS